MSAETITIKVSDFTTVPGARFRTDGNGSAEEFYKDYLESLMKGALEKEQTVLIDFDGTWGYASSFTNELAKRIYEDFDKDTKNIKDFVLLKSDDEPAQIDRFWTEYAKNS